MLPGPTVCQEWTVKQEVRVLPPRPSGLVKGQLRKRQGACELGGEHALDVVRRRASWG